MSMKTKRLWILAAGLITASALCGCSGQSVTYDPGAGSSAVTPAETAERALSQVSSAVSSAAEAVTLTPAATETPTPLPTDTPTPTPETIAPTLLTATPDPDAGLKTIGEKAEGMNIFKVRLKNLTGMTITYFGVKDNFTDYFPENMLEEDGTVKNNETRVLYYDASHALRESADREERAAYEIRLGLKTDEEMKDPDDEGRYIILHDVPFTDFTDAEMYYLADERIGCVKYRSKVTNKEYSTEEAEKKLRDEQDEEEASRDEDEQGGNNDTSNETGETGGSADDTEEKQSEETYNDGGDEEYVPIEEETGEDDGIVYYDDTAEYEDIVG